MGLKSIGLCMILTAAASPLFAQPAREGILEVADILLAVPENAERSGILFEREVFDRPGEESFRLRFNDIRRGNASDDVRIIIRNRSNEVIDEVDVSAFAARTEYWTRILPGSYALVQVVSGQIEIASGLSFRVDRIGVSARGASLLSKVDPLNPKDRPVAEFSGNPALMKASRSVAKLIISRDLETISCTGFMVSAELMVTNQHCISSAASCSGSYAKFGYERDAAGKLSKGQDFNCVRLLESDVGLDFAIIRVDGSPGHSSRWGHLQLADRKPALGEPLAVVQHPDGDPKRVAVQGCSITTIAAVGKLPGSETDFGHRCDTMTGSSGSPALDASMKVVGLHHMGFDTADARWSYENRAVRAEELRARIAKWTENQ